MLGSIHVPAQVVARAKQKTGKLAERELGHLGEVFYQSEPKSGGRNLRADITACREE